MFKLDKQRTKITSVNPRAELHGDETEPACDIHLKFTAGNEVLDMFDKRLRASLFDTPPKDYEGDLADQGTEQGDDYRPVLRFPDMPKLAWGYKGAGYRVEIEQGFSGEQNIYLIKTEIDKFKFTLQQGGSVEVCLRIICHPNADDFGALCMLVGRDIDITLEPPSAEDRAQMELDDAAEAA